MLPPSGEQYRISAGHYTAVITQSGAALRSLTYGERALLDGFAEDQASFGGRGQLLAPWPNRIRDGRYAFDGIRHQLPLTEPSRRTALHGLVQWSAWSLLTHEPDSVTLGYRVMSRPGYPWTLDLEVTYTLGADGLTITQSATNRSNRPAPYASGAHPYVLAGQSGIDEWTVEVPATSRLLTDAERLLPTTTEAVDGTRYDLRTPRPLGDLVLNHAYSSLERDDRGRATTRLLTPHGTGAEIWVDEQHRWLMLYTGDDTPATARRSLAVEPMTAPPDAFNSGTDLVQLEPGERFSASWGVRALA